MLATTSLPRPAPREFAARIHHLKQAQTAVAVSTDMPSLGLPDIGDWASQRFYVAETGRPIVLEPVQIAVLRLFFEQRDDGRFKWQTGLYSTIKKSGKTTIAALVQQWACETWGRYGQIYHMGNKLDQAKERAFELTRKSIELSPFAPEWEVQATRLTYLPAQSFIKPLPVNAKGEAGANQCLTTWTEFHGYIYEDEERFWDEMQPVPTQPLSFRFVESYAGYEDESHLLKTLWDRALEEGVRLHPDYPIYGHEASGLIAYIDTGVEARRMPWQQGAAGEEYYRRQEASERPINFRRLHLNQWVSSQNAFVPMELWDGLALDPDERQRMATLPVVIGVDAAVSSDSTAAVAVTLYHDTVIELETQIFLPPAEGKMDYALTLKPALEAMFRRYGVVCVAYDMHQLHDFMTQLGKVYSGIPLYAFGQGAERLKADTALLYRIHQRRLRHSGDPTLRQHIQNADAKEELGGEAIRIVKRKAGKKIDGAVALSMAAYQISLIAEAGVGATVVYESWHDRLGW
ncbi:MAG: phage terminase family protein [Anaerolineae bacterium]|nr:phage terminase family protein [Anaerolineae bacterium]